jgi:hypothetical protein
LLKDQDYAQAIGKKLVVVRGRAGTGKTIKLIHIAYALCRRQEQRCLILTFNKALCSDIQRTIVLAKMQSDLDGANVEVRSVHSFICLLLKKLNFYEEAETDEDFFRTKYESGKNEMLACLEAGALDFISNKDFVTVSANPYSSRLEGCASHTPLP